jgi:hypothetical protein
LTIGCGDKISSPSEPSTPTGDDPVPASEFERFIAATVDVGEEEAARIEDSQARSAASMQSETETAASLSRGIHRIDGPTVITEPGVYVVTKDFSVSEETGETGDGIVIRSNFVWLDLRGHEITGPGNKIGNGIVVDGARFVVAGNGVLSTFGNGVAFLESRRCAVGLLRIEGGDEKADPPTVPAQVGFLLVNSARIWIKWNEIEKTNLGFFVRGNGSRHNRIAGNDAVAGDNGLLAVCYNPAEGEGEAGPRHDVVRRNRLSRFNIGIRTSDESSHNRFVMNLIEYFEAPWVDLNGTNEFIDNKTIQLTR